MTNTLLRRYRISLSFFIVGLVISGLTAFPLLAELSILLKIIGIPDSSQYASLAGLQQWIAFVHFGLENTYAAFPFIAYGTDWLAFAHLIIALFFVGPLIHPTRNDWILYCGLIACIAVIPLALVCGHIRGIPLYWSLIDCSFGIFGMLPLLYCLHVSKLLQNQENQSSKPSTEHLPAVTAGREKG